LGKRGKIFVSYRRDDAPADARGVRDRLSRKFGKAKVFMDVDNLLAGQRFDRELEKALAQCDVLIAIIGLRWVKLLSSHSRSGERDYVHDEIAAALKRGIAVIPTLVGRNGHMPSLPRRDELPEHLRDLALHQKQDIVHESFGQDADELIKAVQFVLRSERHIVSPRAVAVSGAMALVLITALLGYWLDIASFVTNSTTPSPHTTISAQVNLDAARDKAAEDARRKMEADTKAADDARKASNDEAKKRAARSADVVGDCDRLAASPYDDFRLKGVAGVDIALIDVDAATTACNEARRLYPDEARFAYQAGRAAFARKEYRQAAVLFCSAAENGKLAAMVDLGVLYEDGLGVNKNVARAREFYRQAQNRGDGRAGARLKDLK
jgi:hypothetical protein